MSNVATALGIWKGSFSFPGLRKRVLILGSGQLARDLCQVLVSKRKYGVEVVGFVDKDPNRIGECLFDLPIVGTLDHLFETAERHRVQTVAVCLEDRRAVLPVQTLLDFKAMGIEVVDGHDFYEEESRRLSINSVNPSSLIFSSGFRRQGIAMYVKPLVDVVVSAVGLIVLAPLFAVVGAMIQYDSPGPVFYRQMRVGLRGKPYLMWKFRSMYQDAETTGPLWASLEDSRITRVGRWLRKWRLDELPQLLNVLRGEMSLVGPRPERPAFVQELRGIIPYYDIRHTVRPGITGWAQTQFRYGASAEDSHIKLQYDLYYVKNFSLGFDFRIWTETARVILLGEGAR